MASFSKVFKASHLSLIDEVKVISQPLISIPLSSGEGNQGLLHEEDNRNASLHSHLLAEEAKEQAQAIIEAAQEEALLMKTSAEQQISEWWEENEKKLQALTLEAKESGFDDGFQMGKQAAESEIQQTYQVKLEQVEQFIQKAYEQKEAIISEAEPFLLELSTAIAEQIIRQELEDQPDKFLHLIKQHILRFKEKESISICVHPEDFEFIESKRALLVAVVNGETEIKVIPDHTVTPKGCIIRTAYGSVDARIDTQIEEIKKVILEARREPESGFIS